MKEKGFTLVLATTTNDHTIKTYINDNENIRRKAPLDKYFSFKKAILELAVYNENATRITKRRKICKQSESLLDERMILGYNKRWHILRKRIWRNRK